MSCNSCKKDLFIVNKKYGLCDDCNYFRINGATKQEIYHRRSLKKNKTTKVYTIKQTTKKESVVKNKLSIIKNEIRLEAIQSDTYFCKGCGLGTSCDCSHILPVGSFKELETDKENIDLLCRDCHNIWESRDIKMILRLDCFERYLRYMKEHSKEWYNKFITKMLDYKYFATEEEVIRLQSILITFQYI